MGTKLRLEVTEYNGYFRGRVFFDDTIIYCTWSCDTEEDAKNVMNSFLKSMRGLAHLETHPKARARQELSRGKEEK